ncbi:TlpA family protein disulfide reductase [Croceitalea marina]|uniref:TlpA family protein disulfide reductase n=1 Tax=Croceitalea marina TaxID=1775166 RepID=A0ABW5N0S9_9FLAO
MSYLKFISLFGAIFLVNACANKTLDTINIELYLSLHNEQIAFKSGNVEFPFYFLEKDYPDYFNFQNFKSPEGFTDSKHKYITTSHFDYSKSASYFGEEHKFKEPNFEVKEQENQTFFSFLTTMNVLTDDKQILLIDINNDKSFEDEVVYVREKNKFKSIDNKTPVLNYNQFFYTKNGFESYNRIIEIQPYNGKFLYYRLKDTMARKMAVVGLLKDYWRGKFSVDNNTYEIVAQGFNSNNIEFLIKDENLKFSKNDEYYNTNYRYQMNDTILLNSKAYKIDTLSFFDDNPSTITLSHVPNYKPRGFGFRIGEEIGNILLLSLKNENVAINKVYDKSDLTIFYFWGTWCIPCRETTDYLIRLREKYPVEINVVGIAYEKNMETLIAYEDKKGKNWQNFFTKSEYNPNSITQKLRIDGFPSFIAIDKKGIIHLRGSGLDAFKQIEELISNN